MFKIGPFKNWFSHLLFKRFSCLVRNCKVIDMFQPNLIEHQKFSVWLRHTGFCRKAQFQVSLMGRKRRWMLHLFSKSPHLHSQIPGATSTTLSWVETQCRLSRVNKNPAKMISMWFSKEKSASEMADFVVPKQDPLVRVLTWVGLKVLVLKPSRSRTIYTSFGSQTNPIREGCRGARTLRWKRMKTSGKSTASSSKISFPHGEVKPWTDLNFQAEKWTQRK